jgi:hypothetical protein
MLFVLALARPARAVVVQEDPLAGTSLEVGGTIRSFDFVMHGGLLAAPFAPPNSNPAGVSLDDLRAKIDWHASESLRLVVHDELAATAGTLGLDESAGPIGLGQGRRAPVWLPMQWSLASGPQMSVQDRLDWLWARWTRDRVQLTVGRQPITFGRGVLWTPLDLLSPFSPLQIDTEFKPGVDALRADLSISSATLSLVEVVGRAAGAEDLGIDAAGSAMLARLEVPMHTTRVAATAGYVRSDVVGGLDAFYDLGHTADLHGAATVTYARDPARRPQGRPAFVRMVVGSTFEPARNLHATVEAYYNGSGAADSSGYLATFSDPRFQIGEEYNVGRYYAGAVVDWQPQALVHVALAVLSNLTDPSAIASPQVRYSVASNALIICGAFVPMGARPGAGASGPTSPSEFGLYPYLYHVDLKVYM